MQRDMKVGMALGVALVGIVGALFFRRDPIPQEPAPPALQDVEEIDKQIADKAKAPYIQGLDEFVESPAAPAKPGVTSPGKARPDAYEVPGFLTKEDHAEQRNVLNARPAAAPDPIATSTTTPGAPAAVPQLPPAHNRDWEPVGAETSRATAGTPRASTGATATSDARPGQRTHVTQPGDTLSGIAARYLGSSARFREIYEANRNVLRSPDDLPDGVTLVIPETGKAHQAPPPASHTAESAATPKIRKASGTTTHTSDHAAPPAVSGEFEPGKLRFAPVSRGPFSAGRSPGAARGAAPTRETPAAEGKPSRPRIEIDDSDPFSER